MNPETDIRLTPGQRLSRGLKYTAIGPVDVTRGAVGLSVHGAQSSANRIRNSIDKSRLAKEIGAAQDTIAQELAVAQEVLANLPSVIADARKPRRKRRPLLLAAVGVVAAGRGSGGFLDRAAVDAAGTIPLATQRGGLAAALARPSGTALTSTSRRRILLLPTGFHPVGHGAGGERHRPALGLTYVSKVVQTMGMAQLTEQQIMEQLADGLSGMHPHVPSDTGSGRP